VVGRSLGTARPLGSEEVALPEGADECAALSDALRQWKARHGVRGVVLGLDPSSFSFHFLDLPVKSERDIRSALPFEMERHLPLPPDEYVMGHATVQSGQGGSRNLVLALRADRARRLAGCVEGAGLKLLGIRCTAMEAISEFAAKDSGPGDSVFVFKGEDRYYVVGLKGAAPVSVRAVRSADEARAEAGALPAGRGVFIAGGGPGDIPGARALPYRVEEIMASSGGRGPLRLEFAPPELSARKPRYYNYAIAGLSALAVVLFLATTLLAYYKERSALSEIEARMEEIKSTARELMETQREIEAAGERKRFLLDFQSRRNRNIRVLRQLSALLPEGAWLTNFSADDKGRVEIQGYADKTAGIIGPLENSETFRNVEFSSPVIVRAGKERFAIKMEVEK